MESVSIQLGSKVDIAVLSFINYSMILLCSSLLITCMTKILPWGKHNDLLKYLHIHAWKLIKNAREQKGHKEESKTGQKLEQNIEISIYFPLVSTHWL
jgi:hypothetical protein